MENYEVTIAYKAILTLNVKADSKEEAEKLAQERFKNREFKDKRIEVVDDNFSIEGVLNLDKTWGQL
jgi:hypothetical protein